MSDSPPPPTPDLEWLTGLIERARDADGQPPFSDGSLVALAQGERRLIRHEQSAAIVSDTEAEFVVEPDARRHGLGRALLHELLVGAPGDLLLWSHGDHPGARALAQHFGLEPVRELLQLRAEVGDGAAGGAGGGISTSSITGETSSITGETSSIGGAESSVGGQGGVSIRPAAYSTGECGGGSITGGGISTSSITGGGTGADWRDAWVRVNAAAFAGHPEQGSVTRNDLDALTAEEWFDEHDVLLAWYGKETEGEELVGFCWLKVEDPVGEHQMGEFYVVGVAPEWQGRGLGRELVQAGMTRLREKGIRTASLYVEADNAPALRLYRSFGFTEHSIDVQYRWRSEPDDPA